MLKEEETKRTNMILTTGSVANEATTELNLENGKYKDTFLCQLWVVFSLRGQYLYMIT